MSDSAEIRIIEAGRATTIQDRGRRGWAHLGVPRCGPLDAATSERMNRLVGNAAGCAVLETAGGLVIEALSAVVVARNADDSRLTLAAGERLRVDPPPGRLWAYLALRGGVDVDPVLGSRSHDTLSGLGPPPIVRGTTLSLGADPRTELTTELAPDRRVDRDLRLWPGPQLDWFASGADALFDEHWTTTIDVSRVGRRLAGPTIRAAPGVPRSMRSAGLVVGAIQVPSSGTPIVMLANHPTTGGYPVIAVVDPDDIGLVAQSPPGSAVRFVRAVPE